MNPKYSEHRIELIFRRSTLGFSYIVLTLIKNQSEDFKFKIRKTLVITGIIDKVAYVKDKLFLFGLVTNLSRSNL